MYQQRRLICTVEMVPNVTVYKNGIIRPIERVNREFKRRTKSMDALGERTLQVLLAFTAIRLEFGWQTTPLNSSRLEGLEGVKRNQIESTMETLIH